MNTYPLCEQACEWIENEFLNGYVCKPCHAWFRVTKDANGDPLLDMSVTNGDSAEIQPKLLAWWAKLNEQWSK